MLAIQWCYFQVFQNERNVRPLYKQMGNGNDNQFCIDWDCLPVKYKWVYSDALNSRGTLVFGQKYNAAR